MAKRQHKYFVNQRYKHKIDQKYMGYSKYYTTIDPDPRYAREHRYNWHGIVVDEPNANGLYIYDDRPEIKYTVRETNWDSCRKKDAKKFTNRKLRHMKDIGSYGYYKRVFDLGWYVW